MLIDEGRDALPSKIGALCSLLLLVVMVTYTGYKIYILEGRKSIDIISAVKENYFNNENKFGAQQGLNVAVAVFNEFEESTQELIDPTYGKIRFSKFSWSKNEDG